MAKRGAKTEFQRDAEKLAAILGIEVPDDLQEQRIQADRELDAMVLFFEKPSMFDIVTCIECGREFAVDRANVALCSNKCKIESLHKRGISRETQREMDKAVGPKGPRDEGWVWKVWWGNEPLIVTPPNVLVVEEARALSDQFIVTKDDGGEVNSGGEVEEESVIISNDDSGDDFDNFLSSF